MPNIYLLDYFSWVVFVSLLNTVLLQLQDEEINQQSQLVEKLKTQMLDQEEVSFALRFLFYFLFVFPLKKSEMFWIGHSLWPGSGMMA